MVRPLRPCLWQGSGVEQDARRKEDHRDTQDTRLDTWAAFSATDLLDQVAVERMLAGVATRRHADVAEPLGAELEARARGTSRSALSRRFGRATERALAELMARDLSDLDVAVRMVDGIAVAGIAVAGQSCVAALVITTDGRKVPVGLYLGDTENATMVTALLADLQARGPSRRLAACSSSSRAPRPSRPASAASSARRPRSSAAPSASGATWLTTCPQGARRPDRPSLGPGIQRPRPGSRSRPDEGDRRQP